MNEEEKKELRHYMATELMGAELKENDDYLYEPYYIFNDPRKTITITVAQWSPLKNMNQMMQCARKFVRKGFTFTQRINYDKEYPNYGCAVSTWKVATEEEHIDTYGELGEEALTGCIAIRKAIEGK